MENVVFRGVDTNERNVPIGCLVSRQNGQQSTEFQVLFLTKVIKLMFGYPREPIPDAHPKSRLSSVHPKPAAIYAV